MISLLQRIIFTALLSFAIATPVVTFAQLDLGFDQARDLAGDSGLSTAEPRTLIVSALRYALGFVGIIAVAVIIYGGVLYITSAGDDTKAEKAKKLLMYAIVGLLLVGAAALIVNVSIYVFDDSAG